MVKRLRLNEKVMREALRFRDLMERYIEEHLHKLVAPHWVTSWSPKSPRPMSKSC